MPTRRIIFVTPARWRFFSTCFTSFVPIPFPRYFGSTTKWYIQARRPLNAPNTVPIIAFPSWTTRHRFGLRSINRPYSTRSLFIPAFVSSALFQSAKTFAKSLFLACSIFIVVLGRFKKQVQKSALCVKAILGLVEDDRLRPVYHLPRHFQATIRGKVVRSEEHTSELQSH